ncbi:cytochrome P450 [Catenulispora yoronensis]
MALRTLGTAPWKAASLPRPRSGDGPGDHDPAAVSRALFELGSAACRRDPHPVLNALREAGPVLRTREGLLVATSHAVVSRLLADPSWAMIDAGWRDGVTPGWQDNGALRIIHGSLLGLDGPDHARHRRLTIGALTRAAVERLRPRLAGIVDRLLDEFVDALRAAPNSADPNPGVGAAADFHRLVAARLPALALCALFGLPESDHGFLAACARELAYAHEFGPSRAQLRAAAEQADVLTRYLRTVQAAPDGLLAELRRQAPDHLDDIVGLVGGTVVVAGWETTTFSLGDVVSLLARFPDQAERVRQDPYLVRSAVEEMLRFEPPVLAVMRRATAAGELGGEEVAVGQPALLLIGAAHRDPAAFPEPEYFDVSRFEAGRAEVGRAGVGHAGVGHAELGRAGAEGAPPPRALTFGRGAHLCVGMHLNRLEVELVLAGLLERLPVWSAEGVYAPGRILRSFSSLTLRC